MKIKDEELLHEIWRVQLENTASGVINHYIGGKIGLKSGNYEDSKYFSCDVHIMDRDKITKKVGYTHLLHRIRKLADEGSIKTLMTTLTHLNGKMVSVVLTFMIDCKEAEGAFNDACEFWRSRGVPSGYYKLEDDRTCARTNKDVDYDKRLKECREMLIKKYGEITPRNRDRRNRTL
jgi:hypothetical protein